MKAIIQYFFTSVKVGILWVGLYFEIEGLVVFRVGAIGKERYVGSDDVSLNNESETPMF